MASVPVARPLLADGHRSELVVAPTPTVTHTQHCVSRSRGMRGFFFPSEDFQVMQPVAVLAPAPPSVNGVHAII